MQVWNIDVDTIWPIRVALYLQNTLLKLSKLWVFGEFERCLKKSDEWQKETRISIHLPVALKSPQEFVLVTHVSTQSRALHRRQTRITVKASDSQITVDSTNGLVKVAAAAWWKWLLLPGESGCCCCLVKVAAAAWWKWLLLPAQHIRHGNIPEPFCISALPPEVGGRIIIILRIYT